MKFRYLVAAFAVSVACAPAMASTCLGVCSSTIGPDGDISSPPAYGPGFSYVTTAGGVTGAGQIAGSGGTNGSEYITDIFSANAGDALNFYFNYVTSDGSSGFPDYAFAELQTGVGTHVAWLFTARTVPAPGNTSPGNGLPANDSTLTPATTAITLGTTFSGLDGYSGSCFGGSTGGCGHTGWINSNYNVAGAGAYQLRFGVTNFSDTQYDSALAFAGITVAGTQVPDPGNPGGSAAPEPATWAMMVSGFGLVGAALRRRGRRLAVA